MLTVYGCIVNEHDLRLVGSRGDHMRPGFVHRHHAAASRPRGERPYALCLARRRRDLDRLRHLGDAFHRHAGVLAGHSERLQRRADHPVAGRRDRADRRRPRGRACRTRLPGSAWLGGAIVGGGIAVMHYTGMAAFEIEGRIVWDPALVTASIACGGVFGAVALRGRVARRHHEVAHLGRAAADGGDLQPSISPRWARSRSFPIRPFMVSKSALPTSWLAVARRARELHDHHSRLRRPGPRHPRPTTR